jgi:hypothetical protein
MRHKAAVFVISLIVVIGLATAWGFHRNSRVDTRFGKIRVGASESEVVKLLGRPSWIEPCGKSFGTPKPNCTELIYRNSFAPVIPEYHSVILDSSGKVQETYIYSSP